MTLTPAADTQAFHELKNRLQTTWMSGDYDTFARYMERDAETFYDRLAIPPGTRLLDVGCGAGQLALIAARRGATVTGCDIAANWLEKARARADAEGLTVTFELGDAEALPYVDGQFDVVTSLVGAMFAPRPDKVSAELARVCRPGGMLAMANWTPSGFVGQMFRTISGYIAPPGMPSPVLWGDVDTVNERLRAGFPKLDCTFQMYEFDYPFSPEGVVDFFRVNYGPMTRAFAALEGARGEQLRRDLANLWSAHNHAGGNRTRVLAEYLQVIGIRG